MNLSRQKRKTLQRRANRLMANLRGEVVSTSIETSPRLCAVLLTERARPVIVNRARIQPAMHAIGLHVEGLDETLLAIAESPEDDGMHYPVLVLIDGWLQVGFVEVLAMSCGGVA